MKRTIFFIIFGLMAMFVMVSYTVLSNGQGPAADDESEIDAALQYLNAVRNNPAAYSEEIGVDLSDVPPQPELKWNTILAKVAKEKARDMVDRNYFAHVDPDGNGINIKIHNAGYTLNSKFYSDSKSNYFESLAAGNSGGKASVIQLINDGGGTHEQAGHRQHLLGIKKFWANCYDIGIGRATGGKYGTVWCFIIAKHDF